jgi:hypothetical protein
MCTEAQGKPFVVGQQAEDYVAPTELPAADVPELHRARHLPNLPGTDHLPHQQSVRLELVLVRRGGNDYPTTTGDSCYVYCLSVTAWNILSHTLSADVIDLLQYD